MILTRLNGRWSGESVGRPNEHLRVLQQSSVPEHLLKTGLTPWLGFGRADARSMSLRHDPLESTTKSKRPLMAPPPLSLRDTSKACLAQGSVWMSGSPSKYTGVVKRSVPSTQIYVNVATNVLPLRYHLALRYGNCIGLVIGGHLTPILHFVRCVVVVHAVAVLQVLNSHRGWIGMPISMMAPARALQSKS